MATCIVLQKDQLFPFTFIYLKIQDQAVFKHLSDMKVLHSAWSINPPQAIYPALSNYEQLFWGFLVIDHIKNV